MTYYKPHTIFSLLASYLPKSPVIVEAGAFTGHDTLRLAAQFPHGTVHAFEPVPSLFQQLKKNTQPSSNIICYPVGLSDRTGTAHLHISEKPEKPGVISQANSLHQPKERLSYSSLIFTDTVEIPVTTLEAWGRQHTITQIDALWLDLQGHELHVLEGMGALLETVRVIHTEVSFLESYEGIPQYADVQAWMHEHNFKEVGQNFKNTTDWFFGNAVFIQNTLKTL